MRSVPGNPSRILRSVFNSLLPTVAGLACSSSLQAAATFQETGGLVVIEAEHFDSRASATDDNHAFYIVPDELSAADLAAPAGQYQHARGGRYMVSLPDSAGGGQNRNDETLRPAGPHLDYKVQISTTGEYQLYVRAMGYDGSSDSAYAYIVELTKASGGPGPDYYRYSMNPDTGDFNTLYNLPFDNTTTAGWTGNGNPEVNNGGDNGDDAPVVWTIAKAGVYTIRWQQREDGNGIDALILQRSNLPVPASPGPAESALAAGFLIGTQPSNVTITPGKTATFTVSALAPTGASVSYQWQQAAAGSTNFTSISGATSASFTTPATTTAMNGTQYRAVVTSGGTSLNSAVATLTTDATPPAVLGAFGSSDLKSVTVRFSKKVDPTTANVLGNYTITGLTLSNPQLQANGTDVVLTTTTQTANTPYTIAINGIKDLAGNVLNNGQAKFTGATFVLGGVLQKFYTNVTQTTDALRSDPRFPNNPTYSTIEPRFEYPPNAGNEAGDNYGNTLSGWIVPPVSGAYVFFVCSDDQSDLFLSTDDNPANIKLIAQESAWSNPRQWTSSGGNSDLTAKRSDQFTGTQWPGGNTITLTAGQKYYIEAQHVEGGGGDNIGVAWQKPGDTVPADNSAPIDGAFVGITADPSATITITQQPTNITVQASAPLSLTVGFTAFSAFGTGATIQWQRAPAGSSTFANVAGATAATLSIPFASPNDNGAQYRAVLTAASTQVNSAAATLTVSSDTTPPVLTSVNGSVSTVFVSFNEPLDAASAANKANYSLSGGATVSAATVTSASGAAGVVQLTIAGATAGTSYDLTVTGVKDLSNNAMAASTRSFIAFNIFANFNDANVPTGAAITGNADIQAAGSYDSSGFLELTPPVNSMQGSIVFSDVINTPITKFTATWKMFIGQGSGNPADGVAFLISPGLDDTASFGEEGMGTGIIFEFDTYDNGNYCVTGTPEAPAIVVKYGGGTECPVNDPNSPGNEIVRTNLAKAVLVNNRWVDVAVQVTSAGKVTVIYDNVKYFDNVQIPGWAPLDAGSRPAFGGRTGGEHEANWVDDIAILYNADLPLAQPPTVSITSPADNATFPAGSSVTVSATAQEPGGNVTKVEFFANGSSIGSATAAPYSLTIPSVPQGAYVVTAAVTDARGITVTSAPVKVVVGTPPVVLLVTADPGPLTFPGDQAIYNHLLGSGFDVQITTGSAVPDDGSLATGKALVIISSSLGSSTVVAATTKVAPSGDSKFLNVAVPVMEWESALQDNFDFQADADPKGTTDGQTDVNIVDATSPLAAGLTAGTHTVVTSPQTFSWGTPVGAHIVATMSTDPTQACLYYYDKGDKTLHGLLEPARRVFFFLQDNTAQAVNDTGWKLFDAAVTWLVGGPNTGPGGGAAFSNVAISSDHKSLTLTYTGSLQSADNVTGPWTDVANASSPATVQIGSGKKFYRVH